METQKEIITKSGVLRGVINIPNVQIIKGIIIIIHGYFSSNKIGPARLYVQLARLFEILGYCVYRFDAYGVGDSDGEYIDFSFDSQKRDFLSIIEDVKKCYPKHKIILCGHSAGSNISMLLASQLNEIEKMILISPAFGFFSGKEKLLEQQDINELNLGNVIYRKGIPINKNYIEKITNETIFFTKIALSVESFIFIGNDDQFYDINHICLKSHCFENHKLFTIDFADHNFLDPIGRKSLFDELRLILK